MEKTYSIAIDGPAGAGKSTIAKRLAKELGFYYVDTGAIYRTVAYFLDLLGVSPKDVDGVERYIDELTIDIEYDEDGFQHMIMNGMDVSEDIRTPDISMKASFVSAHAVVRDMLLDMQRDVAKKHNVIMDGRDIGTVVLPRAQVKIFLTASAEVRAKRRHMELQANFINGQTFCQEALQLLIIGHIFATGGEGFKDGIVIFVNELAVIGEILAAQFPTEFIVAFKESLSAVVVVSRAFVDDIKVGDFVCIFFCDLPETLFHQFLPLFCGVGNKPIGGNVIPGKAVSLGNKVIFLAKFQHHIGSRTTVDIFAILSKAQLAFFRF